MSEYFFICLSIPFTPITCENIANPRPYVKSMLLPCPFPMFHMNIVFIILSSFPYSSSGLFTILLRLKEVLILDAVFILLNYIINEELRVEGPLFFIILCLMVKTMFATLSFSKDSFPIFLKSPLCEEVKLIFSGFRFLIKTRSLSGEDLSKSSLSNCLFLLRTPSS